MDERFNRSTYLIRKKVLHLFGQAFHIFDSSDNVVFFSKMKAFKLKEDIRIYTTEEMTTEVLTIKARQILDFSAAYDVFDPLLNQHIGILKRKGFQSMLKDEWSIMNSGDREIGTVKEDNLALAIVRRAVGIVPQSFTAELNGRQVCKYSQNFNPFVFKLNIDFSEDRESLFDRRLGIAAGILLAAIEGRQE